MVQFTTPYNVTIWNLNDPCVPTLLATLTSPPVVPYPPQTMWSPFSVVGSGDLLYAAWCQAGAFAFDVSDPDEPCQAANSSFYPGPFPENPCPPGTPAKFPLGRFDTYCLPVTNEWNGARAIDPFLGPDRILVADSVGGLSVLSSAGRSYELSVGTQILTGRDFAFHRPPAQQALLSAQFSAGALPGGWTASGLWNASASCPRSGGECVPTGWAYFGNNPSCNFNLGNVTGVLTAPPVTIPSHALSATLRYCSAYQGEGGNSNVSGRDWAWVTVNGTEVDDASQIGNQLTWKTREVNLTGYIGTTIDINWRFDSRDSTNNTGLGWQVAQVEVLAVLDPNRDELGTIQGLVFDDLDGDGSRDGGEPGLQGRTVFLDRDNNGLLDAAESFRVTDSLGQYQFTNLYPSTYTVTEVVPASWTQTAPLSLLGEKRGHWHGSADYGDVWAEGNIAFVGHFGNQGVDIIDVSDPTDPQQISTWNHNPLALHAADIKTKDGIAFIASDGAGVFVVDVRNPAQPRTLKRIGLVANSAQGVLGNGFDLTHNIYIEGNYLYMVNSTPGAQYRTQIRIFNISDPCNPYPLLPHLDTGNTTLVPAPGGTRERIHDITVKNGRLFQS